MFICKTGEKNKGKNINILIYKEKELMMVTGEALRKTWTTTDWRQMPLPLLMPLLLPHFKHFFKYYPPNILGPKCPICYNLFQQTVWTQPVRTFLLKDCTSISVSPLGLNRVPNFAEYRVFEAVFAEYRYWVFDKV